MNGISFYISAVKNLFRILGITALTVLYFATISLIGGISHNLGFLVKSSSEKAKSELSVSINQFSNSAQSESLVNPLSNTLPATFKDSNNEFSAIVKIRELFFANEFSQYIFYVRNFLIKYGKSNIIFPFHNFW